MQGGEPLSVRSSVTRVKRGTGIATGAGKSGHPGSHVCTRMSVIDHGGGDRALTEPQYFVTNRSLPGKFEGVDGGIARSAT